MHPRLDNSALEKYNRFNEGVRFMTELAEPKNFSAKLASYKSSCPPLLSILIVSFNTKQMTLECLSSLFEFRPRCAFEVLILDNKSSDGSPEAIREHFGSRVTLIESEENVGFAAGNNRLARSATGEYLLLLNPDTVILEDSVNKLLDFAMSNKNAKIWGGKTVFRDGRLNPTSYWGRQTIWSLFCQAAGLTVLFRRIPLFNPEGIGNWNKQVSRNVDIISGCFFLIQRGLWRALGGFDSGYFMYGEEADLCLRAHRFGATPRITCDAVIIHHGGASEKVQEDKVVKLLRAKVRLISGHARHPVEKSVCFFLLCLWPLSRYLVHALLLKLKLRADPAPRDCWRNVWSRRQAWSMKALGH